MAATLSDSITSGHATHFTTPSNAETLDTINARLTASIQHALMIRSHSDHMISQTYTLEDLVTVPVVNTAVKASQYNTYSPTHLCNTLQYVLSLALDGWSSTVRLYK